MHRSNSSLLKSDREKRQISGGFLSFVFIGFCSLFLFLLILKWMLHSLSLSLCLSIAILVHIVRDCWWKQRLHDDTFAVALCECMYVVYGDIDESKRRKKNYVKNQSVYCFFPVSLSLSVRFQMACRRTNEKNRTEKKVLQLLKVYTINSKLIKKRRNRTRDKKKENNTLIHSPIRMEECWAKEREKNVPSQIFIGLTEGNEQHKSNNNNKAAQRAQHTEKNSNASKQMKHKWKPKTTTNSIDRNEWIWIKNERERKE